MVALVLEAAGLDPTILIGGDLGLLGGNAKLGKGDFFVTEACEAYGSFLSLRPRMAVVTNIEHDHHDCYPTLGDVMSAFRTCLSQVEAGGCVIACADCPNTRELIPDISERVVTYAIWEDAHVRATDVDVRSPSPTFKVSCPDRDLGTFRLNVPGAHNVSNALAAVAVGCELGVEPEVMRSALAEFAGAERRFDVLGTARGITVVDDYAHHPTEVRASLEAARAWGRRVVAVFQPHLFSRTEALAADFANSLGSADEVIVTEIYAAREQPKPGVSAMMIGDAVNAVAPGKARFAPDMRGVAGEVLSHVRSGDLVVFMGAGDIRESAEELLALLAD
jgi:UDP-N-acetylmuramate--alanine ligase